MAPSTTLPAGLPVSWVTGSSQQKPCLCVRNGLVLQEVMPTESLQEWTDGKCRREHLSWGQVRDKEGDRTKPGLRWSAALPLRGPLFQPLLRIQRGQTQAVPVLALVCGLGTGL